MVRPGGDRRRLGGVENEIRFHEGLFDEVAVPADVTIHLAWTTEPGKYLNSPQNQELLERSRRFLSRIEGRAVFTGTCFEFDTSIGVLKENSPTKPTNLYAQSKDVLRRDVEKRANSAWVRFFYQYGPWEDERRIVPAVIGNLLRGEESKLSPGGQGRDYLHVEDVASAVCYLASDEAGYITGHAMVVDGGWRAK